MTNLTFQGNYRVGRANRCYRPFKHLSASLRHSRGKWKGGFSHNNSTCSNNPLCFNPLSSLPGCLEGTERFALRSSTRRTTQHFAFWCYTREVVWFVRFCLVDRTVFVLRCSPSTRSCIWKMQTVVRCCKHYMPWAFLLELYAAACKHAKSPESELDKLSFKSLLSAISLHLCSTGATTEPM